MAQLQMPAQLATDPGSRSALAGIVLARCFLWMATALLDGRASTHLKSCNTGIQTHKIPAYITHPWPVATHSLNVQGSTDLQNAHVMHMQFELLAPVQSLSC